MCDDLKRYIDSIYDEMCRVLTDYENMEATEEDIYHCLCKIQNAWEVITSERN